LCEPGYRVGRNPLGIIKYPVTVAEVGLLLGVDEIARGLNGSEVAISAARFVDVRLVRRCPVVQIIAILRTHRLDLLNREQATAAHVPVAAPESSLRVMHLSPSEEPPHCRRTH